MKGKSVGFLCEIYDISRSSYYKNKVKVKPQKEIQDEILSQLITEYHLTYNQTLGYRRMRLFINKLNQTKYSEGYIHRLMKYLGIMSRIRRKKVNRKKTNPDYFKDNILDRNFTADKPNEKWLTDVTEFKIPGTTQKLYLSPILDLYDKSIVTYELSHRNTNQIVFKMFDKAIKENPKAKPLFHSDRGFQYTSNNFKLKIEKHEFNQSMSRPGKCIDNGPMEGFFGTLKCEMFHGRKFESYESLIKAIRKYIEYYNNGRFQAKLKGMAPMEYRNHALA